ncbi:hypothetical protein Gotri_016089, partial [Gossypium trilobum]|nr:hypothetical protein [Gossypium trilobum]
PLEEGTVKINFDPSFNVHENRSFLGIIIRNEVGLIMGACTYPHSHVADAFMAEARACEQAIWFVTELGFYSV